jgi:hypothetical protein
VVKHYRHHPSCLEPGVRHVLLVKCDGGVARVFTVSGVVLCYLQVDWFQFYSTINLICAGKRTHS